MRHGSGGRRQRHRGGNNNNGNRRGNNNRMQVFDSNGPDVRIRGTAHQVVEKYMTLAKDAASAGDRILAESYLQHAEHYQRIINSWEEGAHEGRPHHQQGQPQDNIGNTRDDLALPSSILGSSSKAENQQAAREKATELT